MAANASLQVASDASAADASLADADIVSDALDYRSETVGSNASLIGGLRSEALPEASAVGSTSSAEAITR